MYTTRLLGDLMGLIERQRFFSLCKVLTISVTLEILEPAPIKTVSLRSSQVNSEQPRPKTWSQIRSGPSSSQSNCPPQWIQMDYSIWREGERRFCSDEGTKAKLKICIPTTYSQILNRLDHHAFFPAIAQLVRMFYIGCRR